MVWRDQRWVWSFLSMTCAWLAWLSPATEHWNEANIWMHATNFFSEIQAHCIFELTQSHFHIEMVLLSYFLRKILKDCCLPLLWWGWRARGGKGWLWEHRGAWQSGGGSLQTHAISRVRPGSSDLRRPSAIPCQRPGSVVSPRDLSQGKACSHDIFMDVSCIQAWRGENFALCLC